MPISPPKLPFIAVTMVKAIKGRKATPESLRLEAAKHPEKFAAMVKAARAKNSTALSFTPPSGCVIAGPSWKEVMAGFTKTPSFTWDLMFRGNEKILEPMKLNIFHARLSGRDYEELAMTTFGKKDPDFVDADLCGCTFRSIGVLGGSSAYGRFSDWMNSPASPDSMGHWELLTAAGTRIARGNIILFAGDGIMFWNAYTRGAGKESRGKIVKRITMVLARHLGVFTHTNMSLSINGKTTLHLEGDSGGDGALYINGTEEHAWVSPEKIRPESVKLLIKMPSSSKVKRQDLWKPSRGPCSSCGKKHRFVDMKPVEGNGGNLYCDACHKKAVEAFEARKNGCAYCGGTSGPMSRHGGRIWCSRHYATGMNGRIFTGADVGALRIIVVYLADRSVEVGPTTPAGNPAINVRMVFENPEQMETKFRSLGFSVRQRADDQVVLVRFTATNTWQIRYAKRTYNYDNPRYSDHRETGHYAFQGAL